MRNVHATEKKERITRYREFREDIAGKELRLTSNILNIDLWKCGVW